MPWLKCGSCPRVILVSDDIPANSFLCEKCKPLFDLVWSEDWPVGMTMNMNDYTELREKMLRGQSVDLKLTGGLSGYVEHTTKSPTD